MKNKKGFTLIEFLVSLMVGSIVMAAAVLVAVMAINAYIDARDAFSLNQEGRVAHAHLEKHIKGSTYAEITGDNNETLTLYRSTQEPPSPVPGATWANIYSPTEGQIFSLGEIKDTGGNAIGYVLGGTAYGNFKVIKIYHLGNIENLVQTGQYTKTDGALQFTDAASGNTKVFEGVEATFSARKGSLNKASEVEISFTKPFNLTTNIRNRLASFAGVAPSYDSGGTADTIYSLQQASDGGYILGGVGVGITMEGGPTPDFLVIKVDPSLKVVEWAKTYGTKIYKFPYGMLNAVDALRCLQETLDGGYILGGNQNAGGDAFNFLAIKIDSLGNVEWAKVYGGNRADVATSLQQTSDGGYILGGVTRSVFDAEMPYGIPRDAFNSDFMVIKTDSQGRVGLGAEPGITTWVNLYGGAANDNLVSIQETKDVNGVVDGYVLGGTSVSFPPGGEYKYLAVKVDPLGVVDWAKTYDPPGPLQESLKALRQTSDRGYILGAGDYRGRQNFIAIKTYDSGNLDWAKDYGVEDPCWEQLNDIRETDDGGYLMGGYTKYLGGIFNFLAIKTDSSGRVADADIDQNISIAVADVGIAAEAVTTLSIGDPNSLKVGNPSIEGINQSEDIIITPMTSRTE